MNTKINTQASGGDNHYNVYNYIGGICGLANSNSLIQNCASYDNTLFADIYHNGTKSDHSYAYFRIGGVIGSNEGGNVISCKFYGNSTSYDRSWYDHWGYNDGEKAAFLAEATQSGGIAHGSTSECSEDSTKSFVDQMITSITVTTPVMIGEKEIVGLAPYKTHYYIGESLNLYGLLVKDNNGNLVQGYKVTGYESEYSGSQTITVTYGSYTDTFEVTVDNIIPEVIVIEPKKDTYDINETLSINDFSAIIYYNDGTVEVMDNLAENVSDTVKFTTFTNLLSEINTQVLQLNYHYAYKTENGKAAASPSIVAYVAVNVECQCASTTLENQSPATTTEYGYTGDTVCTVCHELVAEGDIEPIEEPETHEHTYTNWASYDYEKHVRTCTSCDETEYQKHETQSVIESGAEYIICLHCDYKDKVETIDPPVQPEHEYSAWTELDDRRHYRTCELCGEQEIVEHNFDTTSGKTVCTDCGYVMLPEEPPVPSAVITAENQTSPAGKTVEVKLDLSNNLGIAYLRLTVKYDTDVLTLVNAENGSIIKDFDQGVNLMWSADTNATADGTMVTLTFEINEAAEAGDYLIDIVIRECYDEDYNDVPVEDVDGVITVIDFIYGDVNGDFKVDGKDVLMLRKYLSNFNDDTGTSTVEVSFGADASLRHDCIQMQGRVLLKTPSHLAHDRAK